MEKVTVAVGDIHGCLDEFDELLKTIQYNKYQMRLVLLGDLMDRGPDPLGCIRRAQELGAECVLGNHEEKNLRWRKHEDRRKVSGKANPMKHMSAIERQVNASLSEDDIKWMQALPLKLSLGYNWWAVHAGCEPCYTLENQSPRQIIRVRYVNKDGVAQALNPDHSQPEGTEYWDTQWKGPESIIYGHCVHDLKHCRWVHGGNFTCLGIDTGCCFGGHLTGAIMKDHISPAMGEAPTYHDFMVETVQVKAKQKYFAGYEVE